jgi:hypothetical protein
MAGLMEKKTPSWHILESDGDVSNAPLACV